MKTKSEYNKIVKSNIKNKESKAILLKQIENYYDVLENYKPRKHSYKK
ncbi:hypothetical protein IKN40_09690 [bacterium]|nr:hypothetical protein [bacterium]